MKKAPLNLPAAGALGEQLTFLDPPEFSPGLPKRATLADMLLMEFLKGESFIHPEWQDITHSWRLAATVQALKDLDWPVQALPVLAPTERKPDRTIARYRLPQDAIDKGRELLRGAA
jgi:hypothetical protein